MNKKGLTDRFTVGQRVAQLYHGSNGRPTVVDLEIVAVSARKVTMKVLSPVDESGPYTVAFPARDLPRTYDPKDVDRMFTDYIKIVHRWSDLELPADYTSEDFSSQIKRLKSVLAAWQRRKASVEGRDGSARRKPARGKGRNRPS